MQSTARTNRRRLIEWLRIVRTRAGKRPGARSVSTKPGVIWMSRENICWVLSADIHNDAVEDIQGVASDRLSAGPAKSNVGYKIDRPIGTRRIKLQRCVRGKGPVADGEHAVVTQSGDFNHVSVSIDGVARVWSADVAWRRP